LQLGAKRSPLETGSTMAFGKRLATMICVTLGLGCGMAQAVECATPQSLDGAAPTPVSAELKQKLSAPDVYDKIPDLFAAVRALYPKASKPDVANYLIAAFCPIVNATPDIGEVLKKARIQSFANGVIAAAY
jgi:hypothetical protein